MLFAVVRLRLTSPAAVAAPERVEADPDSLYASAVHLPVARDGWDDGYHIPATSLAGSFRAHLRATRPEHEATLMGDAPGIREEDAEATPSALRFLGTDVELPGKDGSQASGTVEYRRRTAVDRHRAAASNTTLRTHEVLPADTTITLHLRLDHADATLTTPLLDALADWRPFVGGGRSVGMGQAEVIELLHGTLDLGTSHGLRKWLTLGGPDLVRDVATQHRPTHNHPREPWLQVSWRIADALHIGTGERQSTGTSSDPTRRTRPATVVQSKGTPYVPGSTWKGILRSRCEYIARSVGLLDGGSDCDSSRAGGTCGQCLLCDAFGWSAAAPRDHDVDAPVAARGRLYFADSPVHAAVVVTRDHVALDRVFGGAADKLLHAQQVVEAGTLDLVVHQDPERPLSEPAAELVQQLLILACHDIHDGYVGIGGGTTRGQGTLTFDQPDGSRPGHADQLDREWAVLVLADAVGKGASAFRSTDLEETVL